MESGAKLQQRRDFSMHLHPSAVGSCQACNDAQQRALARAVAADNRQAVTFHNVKRDTLQCVKILSSISSEQISQMLAQQHLPAMPVESFGDVFAGDDLHPL